MSTPPPAKPTGRIGTRHVQIFIMSLGIMCTLLQKIILGIGLVAMAERRNDSIYPVIDYTTSQRGILSSMYFYGGVCSSIPWSLAINWMGAIRIFSIMNGIACGIIACLLPLIAIYLGFECFCVARVVQGISYGSLLPCVIAMMSNWVVPAEREQFSWIWCGSGIASVIGNPIGGLLAASPGGWPSTFYFSGLLSIIWGICCLKFATETPALHPTASKKEVSYITYYVEMDKSEAPKMSSVPWISIATSIPLWSMIFCSISMRWVDGFVFSFIPTFLSTVYNIPVQEVGFLTTLPTLASVCMMIISASIGKLMVGLEMSSSVKRKCWNSLGLYGAAVPLLICAFTEVNLFWAVTLLTISFGITAATNNGLTCNYLELAPNFSGPVSGFASTLSSIGPVLSTSWIGYVIKDQHDLSRILWNAVGYIAGNTIFIVFGTSKVQKWNRI